MIHPYRALLYINLCPCGALEKKLKEMLIGCKKKSLLKCGLYQ